MARRRGETRFGAFPMPPTSSQAHCMIAYALVSALVACDGPCDPSAPGVICALAGTGEFGFNRDGHPPEETDFYLLSAVRRGPEGRIYLMDFNNQRVRRIDDEGLVRTVIGNGFHALADPSRKSQDRQKRPRTTARRRGMGRRIPRPIL